MKLALAHLATPKEPSIVPANDADEAQRDSGIFLQRGPTALVIAEAARRLVRSGPVAVVLAPTVNRGPSAAAITRHPPSEDLGYPLELRLASWLTAQEESAALDVPTYMKPWLPVARVAVVPMRTPCWTAGHLVVALDGLTRADVRALEELATDFAVELETKDRRDRVVAMRSERP